MKQGSSGFKPHAYFPGDIVEIIRRSDELVTPAHQTLYGMIIWVRATAVDPYYEYVVVRSDNGGSLQYYRYAESDLVLVQTHNSSVEAARLDRGSLLRVGQDVKCRDYCSDHICRVCALHIMVDPILLWERHSFVSRAAIAAVCFGLPNKVYALLFDLNDQKMLPTEVNYNQLQLSVVSAICAKVEWSPIVIPRDATTFVECVE